ncbi:archaellin/type IV pilin N-terminal domain-containing protein [Stygiolobus caldivivus]|uniref:Uncharacterized protein n=1 Tax=Stygiolobus caldivivus TaxID=2824673 RepID=A0A8D5U9I0_9CREN|nr:archaellin/type IV pilin N-terminal domain-containing protein [Stygiolobus caldivivus]BCU71154.1 hypothetical protein KN1_24510 [Stygiolobus caldivivus]
MRRNKRGISSILGAVIFIQIVLLSLLLLAIIQERLGSASSSIIQKLDYYSQTSPISVVEANGNYMLVSANPEDICYIIYPNNFTPVHKKLSLPISVSSVLYTYPWALIITNKGTWYNISLEGVTQDSDSLITPHMNNVGLPYLGKIPIQFSKPCWNYTRGINSPDPLAIVPINKTFIVQNGASQYNLSFRYAITNAIIEINPPKNTKWVNLTLIPKYVTKIYNYPNESSIVDCIYTVGIYLPVYSPSYTNPLSDVRYGYSDGYVYYPLKVYTAGEYLYNGYGISSNIYQYSYIGDIGVSSGEYPIASYPLLMPAQYDISLIQVDINLYNSSVSAYLMFGYCNYYTFHYITVYKWYFDQMVKLYGANFLQNSPIYIAVPEGVYVVEISY